MPLSKIKETEIRGYAKEYLESLEYWLRIVIDKELRQTFGNNYIDAKKDNGDFLLNKAIRDEIHNRTKNEPHRYPRLIDACLLDTSIKILTKPDLYQIFFKKYFKLNFPLGRDMILEILNRLIYPRNCLYHANPISVRSLEQIVCYTNDILDSIKFYYKENNMNQDFNVPQIMRVTDSFGNTVFREQFNPQNSEVVQINLQKPEFILYPGDKLKIEIEIDPSFSKDDYTLKWTSSRIIPDFGNSNQINLTIEEKHIGERLDFHCSVISKEVWHRFGSRDDMVMIWYRVLPRK